MDRHCVLTYVEARRDVLTASPKTIVFGGYEGAVGCLLGLLRLRGHTLRRCISSKVLMLSREYLNRSCLFVHMLRPASLGLRHDPAASVLAVSLAVSLNLGFPIYCVFGGGYAWASWDRTGR